MPRGDKSTDATKQLRKAKHVEDREVARGRSLEAAARIAWATVDEQDGAALAGAGRKAAAPRREARAHSRARR